MRKRILGNEGYIDPGSIMSVVVALVVLSVGVFAFFTVVNSISPTTTNSSGWTAWSNSTGTVNSTGSTNPKKDQSQLINETFGNLNGTMGTIFQILPIVMIIAVIAVILSFVGSFGRDTYSSDDYSPSTDIPGPPEQEEHEEQENEPETVIQKKQPEAEAPDPIISSEFKPVKFESLHKKEQMFKGRVERVGKEIKKKSGDK